MEVESTESPRITFYTINPDDTVDKGHLYDITTSRLEILRYIELILGSRKGIDPFTLVRTRLVPARLIVFPQEDSDRQTSFQNDEWSHYILKLAFC
jgi:hypothetical protein